MGEKWKTKLHRETGGEAGELIVWWEVTDDEVSFSCDTEGNAKWLCTRLNGVYDLCEAVGQAYKDAEDRDETTDEDGMEHEDWKRVRLALIGVGYELQS